MIRVCIAGLGKTGREIAKVLMEQDDFQIVSAICSPGSDKIGNELGEVIGCSNTGIAISSSLHLKQVITETMPDVVVDFSNPLATLKNAGIFSSMGINMVIGTTGFTKNELKRLFIFTRKYDNGIIYAPNITLGVNVLMLLSNLAANILSNYDFQITEIHHKNKKDSPSGTAIKIACEIEKGLKAAGVVDKELKIPINAIRAGGVVGKHEVMIVGENDKIEISHESFSRKAFAIGAMRAIRFISGKPGYYEMNDVLDLKKVLGDYIEKEDKIISKRYVGRKAKDQDLEESWAL
jgi:4-hydroxy-tetrahydrodipicolinate reductase